MNKLVTILAAVALAAIWLPASAEVLTDEQLEQIYAGDGYELGGAINYIGVTEGEPGCSAYSAVVAQSNIGAVVSGGDADEIKIINLNDAYGETVFNVGDSAVALQSNIGAVVAAGDIGITEGSVTIDNDNLANVFNWVEQENGEGGVEGASIEVETPCGGGTVNSADVHKSALAAQSNIAAAVATGSDIDNLKINNYNEADVDNFGGGSAVALQSNIAAVVSCGGSIGELTDTVRIDNENYVEEVDNRYTGGADSVDASSVDGAGACGALGINSVSATNSAVAAQSNIGAVVACSGNVYNTTIRNINTATVSNTPW